MFTTTSLILSTVGKHNASSDAQMLPLPSVSLFGRGSVPFQVSKLTVSNDRKKTVSETFFFLENSLRAITCRQLQ
jgi:hypothetical protein